MARQPSLVTYNDLNGEEVREILVDWFRQLLSSQPVMQKHLTLPMAKIDLKVTVDVAMFHGGTVPVASPPEVMSILGDVSVQNAIAAQQPHVELAAVVNAAPIPGGQPPDQIRSQHDLPIARPGYGDRSIGGHVQVADIVDIVESTVEETNRRREAAGVRLPQPANGDDATAALTVDSSGRRGCVAEGYIFAGPPPVNGTVEQEIPVDNGAIDIDLTGQGRMKQGGMTVTAGTHTASKSKFGDRAGEKYGSVAATYDLGPAGLATNGGGSRTKLGFGNNR